MEILSHQPEYQQKLISQPLETMSVASSQRTSNTCGSTQTGLVIRVADDIKPKSSTFKELERSPDDEFLLTELGWDNKNYKIYDVSTLIMIGELSNSQSKFADIKCYVDETSKEFFIEINKNSPVSYFTRTTLFNLLECAEKEQAKVVYICFNKDTENLETSIKTFMFVGFQFLNEEEMAQVSFTQTHILLKYDLNQEDSESLDDLEDA